MEENSDDNSTPTPDAEFVKVGTIHDVPEGEGRAFDVNGRSVAVFNIDGQFHAIEDQCPHMGAALSAGFVEDCVVSCPWHAWRFDVRDGTWCDNRRVKIDAFETRVEGEDLLIATAVTPKDSL